jgi:hypothetical protein
MAPLRRKFTINGRRGPQAPQKVRCAYPTGLKAAAGGKLVMAIQKIPELVVSAQLFNGLALKLALMGIYPGRSVSTGSIVSYNGTQVETFRTGQHTPSRSGY